MTSCFHFCSAPICVSICPNDSKGWCSLKFLSNNGNCAFYTSLSLSLTHTHKQVKATSSIHLPLSFIYTHPHPLSLSHPQTHLSGKSEPKRALHNPSATYRPKLKRVREREREREREEMLARLVVEAIWHPKSSESTRRWESRNYQKWKFERK